MSDARGELRIDDDRVRVITWTFAKLGVAIGHHMHEFDYIVVPVTGGTFRVIEEDGSERRMEQIAGEPYLGKAGTAHDVVSATERETAFVEIELKNAS